MKELSQGALNIADAGIDGGQQSSGSSSCLITKVASAGPLMLTARQGGPKFKDLLQHGFGGLSKSRRSCGLTARLLRPHRAPHRHLGQTEH